MDALEAILTRRSVRRYTDEQIDAETTQKLLEAAMNAPSAATQNLLLAARALGLGAVWTGVYPMDGHVAGFTKHCQLPEGVIPLAFVVVGHPAEESPAQNRFSEHRVHSNVW